MERFIDIDLNQMIDNVFISMAKNDKDVLKEYYKDIVMIINEIYFLDNSNMLILMLKENNMQSAKALLDLLLPFIDDQTGTKKSEIKNFTDIIKRKKEKSNNLEESPKYYFSNFEYNFYISDHPDVPKFDKEMIRNNYLALIKSIHESSHKLMINWTSVFPIDPIEINEGTNHLQFKKFFNRAFEKGIRQEIFDEGYKKYIESFNGISLRDVYSMVYDLYKSIKKSKWLLYEISKSNELKSTPFITYLSKLIETESILKDERWSLLSNEERFNFNKQWKYVLTKYKSGMSVSGLEFNTFSKIIVSICKFFSRYGSRFHNFEGNNFIIINEKDNEDDDDDSELDESVIGMSGIEKSINSLTGGMIYEFLRNEFNKFNKTYYGKSLINNNKIAEPFSEQSHFLITMVGSEDLYVSFKNLFNFAKSIITVRFNSNDADYDNENHLIFGEDWNSMPEQYQEYFIKRLNTPSEELQNWFTIYNNIRNVFPTVNENKVKEINKSIGRSIINSLHRAILTSMSYKGILTKIVHVPQLTNEKLYPSDYNLKMEYLENSLYENFSKNKLVFGKAHHFLTKDKFNNMGPYTLKNGSKVDYFEYVSKQNWPFMYALDWISQLSFFHRFINNRMLMVTGATGVGKSTQVPKLLLYGLASIHNKTSGTIICTQPRIPPTWKNAVRIADELCVPIEGHDKSYYNVQYKHSEPEEGGKGRNHQHYKNINELVLLIVTDGTLLLDMNNTVLTKKKEGKGSMEFSTNNIYDIVIIDESHEHNTNMDLILTLMKFPLYTNNRLMLVTISATMDDDEPIYRRFYRSINDNRKYPCDKTIERLGIDRIAVDRRLHISPPGKTTRFTINEYYRPTEEPEDIVKEILSNTTKGDILFFQPGKGKIFNSIKKINEFTPPNTIAVPYYSDLDGQYKEIVENIHVMGSQKILIPKSIILGERYDESLNVRPGTYTRFILVATNIAEASITIPTLKFVVDTGTQNVGKFDFEKGIVVLELVSISEASRLQRKGRVGRTADGDVYYTYEKGSKENIKSEYNIGQQDISQGIFTMISSIPIEIFTDSIYDPSYPIYDDKIKFADLNKLSIGKFIKSNYYLLNNDITYEFYGYYGKYAQQFYKINKQLFDFLILREALIDGYPFNYLNDNIGSFYLIHPNENSIQRNIFGQPIKALNDEVIIKDKHLHSVKLDSVHNALAGKGLIASNGIYEFKSSLGRYVMEFLKSVDMEDFRNVLAYIMSRKVKQNNNIIYIIGMLRATNGQLGSLYDTFIDSNGRIKSYVTKIKNIFKDKHSDFNAIISILNRFIDTEIFNNIKDNKIKSEVEKSMNFLTEDTDITRLLNNLINDGKINKSNTLTQEEYMEVLRGNGMSKVLMKTIEKNAEKIEKMSKYLYINPKVLMKALRYSAKWANYQYKSKELLENIDKELEDIYKFNYYLLNQDELLTGSLLYGYHNNICLHILNGIYMSVYNLNNISSKNKMVLKSFDRIGNYPENLVITGRLNELIFYLYFDPFSDAISFVSRISPSTLIKFLPHIYTEEKYSISNKEITETVRSIAIDSTFNFNKSLADKLIEHKRNMLREI